MDLRDLSSPSTGASAGLRRTPPAPPVPPVPPPPRRWFTRILLPAVILLLAAGLLAFAARDALFPARKVRVVRVVAKEHVPAAPATPASTALETDVGSAAKASKTANAPASAQTGTVVVQAPGWVEPDPYAVFVTALTNGVIDHVRVLEGQRVEVNQEVASMVADDARLALARAEADLARSKALRDAAQTDWDNPIALERMVAVSKAMLAETTAELAQLDAAITEQRAKEGEALAAYERVSKLNPNAAAALDVEQARFRLEAQRALVEATRKQRPVIEAKAARFAAEVKAAEDDLRLKVSIRRALAEAEASLAAAQAARNEAKLRLTRMSITSPVAGVVIQRLVAPGSKIMLEDNNEHSAHIVHIYDPKKLQVRTDVPLAEAAKVGVGQRARIIVDVLPDQEFTGQVTRFVHQADIGKNTVQVKVAIENPSPLLKPDMLARVKFLAAATEPGDAPSTPVAARASTLTVYAPLAAIERHGEHTQVWIVGSDSRVYPRTVTLAAGGKSAQSAAGKSGWIAVLAGLSPGDVLVAEPTADLKEGQRVTIESEIEAPDGPAAGPGDSTGAGNAPTKKGNTNHGTH